MRPLTCMIVDDEPLAVRLLVSYVEKTSDLQLLDSFTDSIRIIFLNTQLGSKQLC